MFDGSHTFQQGVFGMLYTVNKVGGHASYRYFAYLPKYRRQ